MSEASTLLISIPLSLLSATLPQGDVVQHADQLEGQQLLEGGSSDVVQTTSLIVLQSPTLEFIDPVKHHFMTLIKWVDENGTVREFRIYSKIAHKWRQIATLLGFEPGEIISVEGDYRNSCDRIATVLG